MGQIARIWRGAVRLEDGEAYLDLMRRVAIPDYRGTPGNRGAWCLSRTEDDRLIVTMLTFWESRAAIAAFAGENIETAKYYDFDARYLVEAPEQVQHFDVFGEAHEAALLA